MRSVLLFRILVDVSLAICVICGWWYVALPIGLLALWKLPSFVEIIVAGYAFDALYGFSPALGLWAYAGTLITVIAALIAFTMKSSLR